MTIEQRIQELVSNESFVEGIFTASTPDELLRIFDEFKIELDGISKEDAYESVQRIKNEELQADELEDVSGGVAISTLMMFGSPWIPGGPIILGAVAVGALAYRAYYRYKKRK